MMRKIIFVLLISSLFILLAACSAGDSESSYDSTEDKAVAPSSNEAVGDSDESAEEESEVVSEERDEVEQKSPEATTERMIIHKAIMSVNVKELKKAQSNIEKKVTQYEGYIVESSVYKENDDTSSGKMIVRIPEKHFQAFLLDAEGEAADVIERNVTGQDVTEQFVDLQSRVKSKRAVEERLLEFMSNAQKTEDLLKISADLAKVQEEIEVMVGNMKFLENQTSFSTIELTMYENRVVVPAIDSKELNTWEKTKKQLATSTNSILAAGSALIVFFIGNLPVLLILGVIGAILFMFIKRRFRPDQK
ncbi:DUF4349 domain-containing protein [Paenisporosarcina antarctica]|uniref:DUF4349 domain-containing protein n=1 Tax=Paenisporosarcina antarctica TaxID=417367 RepID=A0A4P6ZU22_9BACL|nr:DUF4349 domain-containing protein [Paenisporosarcina antarctica]QBP39723.1 DUF4349 domain-containing protein [Paenisporosarcina antarctica]